MKNLYVINYIIFLLTVAVLTSCSNLPTTPDQEAGLSCEQGWDYDAIVAPKITAKMREAAPGEYCPNGTDGEKFWLAFVKATAKAESSWKNCERYTESKMGTDPVTGKQVVSEGLLQLSFQDAKNWASLAACQRIDYDNPNTILDPRINLECGMEIANALTGSRSTLRASLGRYWSTIRDRSSRLVDQLRADLPECGL